MKKCDIFDGNGVLINKRYLAKAMVADKKFSEMTQSDKDEISRRVGQGITVFSDRLVYMNADGTISVFEQVE